MGKQGDTGEYWAKKEYDLVSLALCVVEDIEEFIEASGDDDAHLWLLYDTKAACQRLIDAFEPEGEPEGGYKDNVISLSRHKATKR